MQSPSVVGVFCEDLREERSGQPILISVFPDTVEVPMIPIVMPKLGLYIRIHLDAGSQPPKTITSKVISSDGSELVLPSWTEDVITKGFDDAKTNAIPLVGLLLNAVLSPFPVNKPGLIVAKILIDGNEYIACNMNVRASATSSAQPASQSQPAA